MQMRLHWVFMAILAITGAPPAFAQSGGAEQQTLVSILAELRSMHEDMRASQTMQVMLAELQIEQEAVNRASDRVEDARSRLIGIQTGLKGTLSRLSDAQDHLSSATNSADQTKWKDEVERTQQAVTMMQTEEQARSSALDEMQTKLRNAQDDLNSTQDQLNALIKKMTPSQQNSH
jgi:predicted nuclease with TOPRIM domain